MSISKREIYDSIYELKIKSRVVKNIFNSKVELGISNKSSFSFLSDQEIKLIESCIGKSKCRILEIGSGEGQLANYLAENYDCLVLGLDTSSIAIERSRIHSSGKSSSFIHTSMDDFDYEKEKFDVIYSIDSIHHSENIGELFNNIHTSLKTGGYLLFTMWFDDQEVKNSKVVKYLKYLGFRVEHILEDSNSNSQKRFHELVNQNAPELSKSSDSQLFLSSILKENQYMNSSKKPVRALVCLEKYNESLPTPPLSD